MKVLVLGQGGREHAIAWKLSRSLKVEKVSCIKASSEIRNEKKNMIALWLVTLD